MTKVFKKFLVIIAVLALTLTLTGCASKVAGKTYVFDSFEYELSEDLTALEKLAAEAAATGIKVVYEKIELTFNEDGTCTLGSYTQDGSKLVIAGTEYKVKGSKIVLEVEEADFYAKVTLKVK